MYAITGATGKLGHLVISSLLKSVQPGEIIALARKPDAASDLTSLGVNVREGDYDRPETLGPALAGARKVLLISGTDVGRRVPQHEAVINAAKAAGVELFLYTSVLHADTSTLGIGDEHRQTEALVKNSGMSYVFLRNSWYTENYTATIPGALAQGMFIGCAGDGRASTATRADYAEAAAAALLSGDRQAGRIYELAGDDAFTRAEFAAEVSRQTGKDIPYRDLPPSEYEAALAKAGLPAAIAAMLAQSDVAVKNGELFDDSRQLSTLIGRPSTPLKDAVAAALKG